MVLQRRDSTLLEGGSSTCPGKCGRDEIRRAELFAWRQMLDYFFPASCANPARSFS